LRGSQTDIAVYTNSTGVYTNTCQNFKAKFRAGSAGYTVNRYSAEVNASSGSVPDWNYSIPPGANASSVSSVCQLGKIVAPNLGSSNQTYYITVDTHYNLPDAFGNITAITGFGNVVGSLTLAPEAPLTVRNSDQCPYYKSLTSSIATNRSICGANQYNWEFTQVLPSAGIALNVNGNFGGSRILPISAIPSVTMGNKYDVKIRAKVADNTYTPFTANPSCVRTIGAAGIPTLENETVYSTVQMNDVAITLYPSLNQGEMIQLSVDNFDGNLSVEILDATGRMIQTENVNVDGAVNKMIAFNSSLANGMYHVKVSTGNATRTLRFVVSK
jgi:hypothetical protein